ncbi:unnamed protein product, partial [Laminaria digitata]
ENGTIINAGIGLSMFLVVDESTLTLNNITLDGGSSEYGGAVSVRSSSTLNVFGCTFTNNQASTGGEAIRS